MNIYILTIYKRHPHDADYNEDYISEHAFTTRHQAEEFIEKNYKDGGATIVKLILFEIENQIEIEQNEILPR
jgi:hypothetical protein